MKRSYLVSLVLMLFMVSAMCFAVSPTFSIDNINVEGNNVLETQYVLNSLPSSFYNNIFLFNSTKAKKNLLKNPYISDIKIKRVLPHTINIQITERKPCCYLKCLENSYIILDKDCFVLEETKNLTNHLPCIVGIDFNNFSIGKPLETSTKDHMDLIIEFSNLFGRYEINNAVIRVDVSNENDIHLYINNVDVLFGNIMGADKKIRIVNSIIESYPDILEKSGTLNIKDENTQPIFKFLT